MIDPLLVHLIDIVSDPAAEGLILAGGFGIRLKQAYLQNIQARTLIPRVPEARATLDFDFFLRISLFVETERGRAVRALLDRLDYREHTPRWQFGKPLIVGDPERKVKIDLMARSPKEDEGIPVKSPRVGSGSGINLHGFETPEAFAVEDSPVSLPLEGRNSGGVSVKAYVMVPHAYASLNMKVKAAHDWLRSEHGEITKKPGQEKHVFDVYVLTAMLVENELAEAQKLAQQYDAYPILKEIRDCARELYGENNAPGVQEIQRRTNTDFDYAVFWEALCGMLGII
jgi:hypothetical protein